MREWAPVVRVQNSQPANEPAITSQPQVVVMPADPLPRPKRWSFVPIRGADNLIVEVVATPEY